MTDDRRKSCCDFAARAEPALFGNGEAGLMDRVRDMEEYINQTKGSLNAIKWVVGILGLANVANLIIGFAGK